MRKRIKFTKEGSLKFIGHLDLLRVFQRAFKRAELPLSYSQGFNPHPLMSFAHPLSLGVTSSGEYVEIHMEKNMDNNEIENVLNATMPNGLKIVEVVDVKEGTPTAMASVSASKYYIKHDLTMDVEELQANLVKFMAQEEINIVKKGKKKGRKVLKTVNIKEGIFILKALEKGRIGALIASGSKQNVNPELMIKALYEFMGIEFDPYKIKVHRSELYYKNQKDGKLKALGNL